MKKFRMMLPVLAVIFAVVGAVGGDFLPITQGYYKVSTSACSQNPINLNEQDCFVSANTQLPICTVTPTGLSAQQAFEQPGCTGVLRHN